MRCRRGRRELWIIGLRNLGLCLLPSPSFAPDPTHMNEQRCFSLNLILSCFTSSVKELQDHITSVLAPVVDSFNLSLTAFDKSAGIPKSESAGEVILSDAWGNKLEPSPITPTGESGPWKLLAGTIKATVEAIGEEQGEKGGKAVVIPGLTNGNTGR